MSKRVCIVGAGASGLSAIKACLEEELEPVCYEKTSSFGGLWKYRNESVEGVGSVMKSTVSNGSKELSMFSDFLPPSYFPNFMNHERVIEYLDMYADNFNLHRYIHYKMTVLNITLADDYYITGRWKVKVQDEEGKINEHIFDCVMVCVGHYAYPHIPKFPGLDSFRGKVLHTHKYKTPAGFEDKRILVIGIGNSGGDTAVELCRSAKTVFLSTRSGTWVVNRVGLYGKPTDLINLTRWNSMKRRNVPWSLANAVGEFPLNLRFDHEKFRLKPAHRLLSQHITVNDELPNCLQSGLVILKNDVDHFTEEGVLFQNDSKEYPIDIVLLATGYETRFPFVSENIIRVKNNKASLYKYIFPPSLYHSTFAVIGQIQFLGSVFPLIEMQCRWVTRVFQGISRLPAKQDMESDIEKTRLRLTEMNLKPSERHSKQIHYNEYMDEIADLIGARPNLLSYFFKNPKLFFLCFFGPTYPYQYRLTGPHTWPGAEDAIRNAEERISAPLYTRTLNVSPKPWYLFLTIIVAFLNFLHMVITSTLKKK